MRLSLRARQVVLVTALVLCSMLALASVYLTSLVELGLEENRERGELLARALFHRARAVVAGATEPRQALRTDPGIRAILESSIAYTQSVTYAAILDPAGVVIAHSSPSLEGGLQASAAPLSALLDEGALGQLRGVYQDSTLEISEPLLLGDTPFGSIRVGLSTVLIRDGLNRALRPAVIAVLVTLAVALILSLVLAQWALKPIHVIKAGLSQLERGEADVRLLLPPGKEFTDLGQSFDAISARLSARDLPEVAGAAPVIHGFEDAVAILDAKGGLLFANSAMKDVLPGPSSRQCFVDDSLPANHPFRRLVGDVIDQQRTCGPVTVRMSTGSHEASDQTEYDVTAHAFESLAGRFAGMMVVARDVDYLSSVQSTVESSRQLASLGRLLTGVAHEVKNPLNAMTIHLELLRDKLASTRRGVAAVAPLGSVLGIATADGSTMGADGEPTTMTLTGLDDRGRDSGPDVLHHVTIIGDEIRRLDEAIQGFLRFIRPDELDRDTVAVCDLIDEVFALVRPDADRTRVSLESRHASSMPTVEGDSAKLRQALLNLALNSCQAMPAGGVLRVSVRVTGPWVVIDVEDSGAGMTPEVLERIFDLYYTTKPDGSGIGLSMVYRIVQLHGGVIEVESTAGVGTRFRLKLPREAPGPNGEREA